MQDPILSLVNSRVTRVAKGNGRETRAGFVGVECLRELGLLCGGISVVLALPLVLREAQEFQTAATLTPAFQAETTGDARPSFPVYSMCVQADEQSAWLRQGHSALVRVSLAEGHLVEQIPVVSERVRVAAHSLDGRVQAYASMPGNTLVVIRDGELCIQEHYDIPSARSTGLAVTADGSQVAAACGPRMILWDLTRSPPGRTEFLVNSITQKVRWCPGGARLLIACDNGVLKMLSVGGEMLWEQREFARRIATVAWGPRGACVAVGLDGGDLVVLDAADGGLRWRRPLDSHSVTAVSFSGDEERLAVAGFDRTVHVVSAESGRRLVTMWGHFDTVTDLKFLSDCDRILSASLDGTLRIWSTRAGGELQKL